MRKNGLKKLIYLLLLTILLAIGITACGEKDDDDDKERKVRKEQPVDDVDDETDEEEESTGKEEPETTPVPTPEPAPEPTPEPVNWEEEYEDFFEEYGPVLKENVSVNAEMNFNGIEYDIKYAYNKIVKGMALFVGDELCELYMTKDILYLCCDLNDEWINVYANIDAEGVEEFEDLFVAELFLEQLNHITYTGYVEVVSEDGILYDVVEGIAENTIMETDFNVVCYINRDKQEISKINIEQDGDVLCCNLYYLTDSDIISTYEYINTSLMEYSKEEDSSKLIETYIEFLENASIITKAEDENGPEQDGEHNWETHYVDYFDKTDNFPDSYAIKGNINMETFSFDFGVTVMNGETWIRYGLGESIIDAYFDEYLLVVGSPNMDSVGWAYAFLDSEEQMQDLFNIDFWNQVNDLVEDITYVDYIGMEEIDETVYDVVEVMFENTTYGSAYINRERQNIYKITFDSEETHFEYFFDDYDEIGVPYEALDGEEMSVDEIMEFFSEALGKAMEELYM